jgi:hypothetical protein
VRRSTACEASPTHARAIAERGAALADARHHAEIACEREPRAGIDRQDVVAVEQIDGARATEPSG